MCLPLPVELKKTQKETSLVIRASLLAHLSEHEPNCEDITLRSGVPWRSPSYLHTPALRAAAPQPQLVACIIQLSDTSQQPVSFMQSGGCLQTRNSKWADFELCRAELSSLGATAAEHWREAGETGWVLESSAEWMVKFPHYLLPTYIFCVLKALLPFVFQTLILSSGLPCTKETVFFPGSGCSAWPLLTV